MLVHIQFDTSIILHHNKFINYLPNNYGNVIIIWCNSDSYYHPALHEEKVPSLLLEWRWVWVYMFKNKNS